MFSLAFTCTSNGVFYSPVMTVTAPAEEFNKGATIQLLSDMLSFSLDCGSEESSHHLYDAPFFLLPFSLSPAFSFPSNLVPVCCIERVFFFFFFLLFCSFPSPTSLQTSINVFICNAKILITGILRSHNTAESQF